MPEIPYVYKAKVSRVVDGDTLDCTIDVGFHLTSVQRLRLLGVNCPEMRGPERDAGQRAKEFTRRALEGRDVVIHTEKSDVFGRWLATVFLDDQEFNERLLAEGFAVPFAG